MSFFSMASYAAILHSNIVLGQLRLMMELRESEEPPQLDNFADADESDSKRAKGNKTRMRRDDFMIKISGSLPLILQASGFAQRDDEWEERILPLQEPSRDCFLCISVTLENVGIGSN